MKPTRVSHTAPRRAKQWVYDPSKDPTHHAYGLNLAVVTAPPALPALPPRLVTGNAATATSVVGGMKPAAPVVDEELETMRRRWLGKRFRFSDGENIYGPVYRVERGDNPSTFFIYDRGDDEPWFGRLDGADCLHIVDDKPEVTTFGALAEYDLFSFVHPSHDVVFVKTSAIHYCERARRGEADAYHVMDDAHTVRRIPAPGEAPR